MDKDVEIAKEMLKNGYKKSIVSGFLGIRVKSLGTVLHRGYLNRTTRYQEIFNNEQHEAIRKTFTKNKKKIIRLFDDGVSIKEISLKMGLTMPYVRAIVNNRLLRRRVKKTTV